MISYAGALCSYCHEHGHSYCLLPYIISLLLSLRCFLQDIGHHFIYVYLLGCDFVAIISASSQLNASIALGFGLNNIIMNVIIGQKLN
jgi:hypothetical protein